MKISFYKLSFFETKSSSDKNTGGKNPRDAKESQAKRCGDKDKIFRLFEFIKLKKSIEVIADTLLKSRAILVFALLIFDIILLISSKIESSRLISSLPLKMLRI